MPHISFSELKNWKFCPFYHKLVNLQKIKLFKGNEYTAFGTALHETCEKSVLEEDFEAPEYFIKRFEHAIGKLTSGDVEVDKDLVDHMCKQGKEIIPHIPPAVEKYFGEHEIFSTEEKLYEEIDGLDYMFKGYIDLVIKTNDGKYHVIDWKTCSWGWNAKKRSDPMVTYQLTLYKNFFAKKHGIDPANVETHFALLKRTAKDKRVEIFRVSSGERKTRNALNLLEKALYNIASSNHVKNRLSCASCEFFKTEHCP